MDMLLKGDLTEDWRQLFLQLPARLSIDPLTSHFSSLEPPRCKDETPVVFERLQLRRRAELV